MTPLSVTIGHGKDGGRKEDEEGGHGDVEGRTRRSPGEAEAIVEQ